ncbi:MAG: hypothetical protein WCE94_08965 [Candidatus Methanoperedens sp.]
MADAVSFATSQIGVIGLMVITISVSGFIATSIISSDSQQSLAGEFSATRLAIEMVGTSKQPANMNYIAGLFEGKGYTIVSDGNHLLTLTITDKNDAIYDTTSMITNVKMAPFTIDSRNYETRFNVNIIPTPDGVIITVPVPGGET